MTVWDKAFFSSVEEWRETAKAIIDKYLAPDALYPFKLEVEVTKLDQQVLCRFTLLNLNKVFDIILPLVEASLEKKWGAFQESLTLNNKDGKKGGDRKSTKIPSHLVPRPGLKARRSSAM